MEEGSCVIHCDESHEPLTKSHKVTKSQCLTNCIVIPPPTDNGWRVCDGQLEVVWMTRPPAPDSLLDFVKCGCKTGCNTMRCSCCRNNLKCTDLCSCQGCANGAADEEDSEVEHAEIAFLETEDVDDIDDIDFIA